MRSYLVTMMVIAAIQASAGGRFDSSALAEKLHEASGAAGEQLKQLQPQLDAQGEQLSGIVTAYRDQGLAKLPQVKEEFDAARVHLERATATILDPENLDQLKALHAKLGDAARDDILEKIGDRMLQGLNVSADQLKALGPLMSSHLRDVSRLLDTAWEAGGLEALPDLHAQLKGLWGGLDKSLSEILSPEQMKILQNLHAEALRKFESELGGREASDILKQLGDVGQNRDEITGILQDGFREKAEHLKGAQADLAARGKQTLEVLAEVDAGTRERLGSVLDGDTAQSIESIQDEKLSGLRSRLSSR